MSDLALFVVMVPFAMGAVVSLAVLMLPSNGRVATLSFLLPAAAVIVYVLNEGLPPFPPLAAKQKLPYVLIAAAAAGPLLSTLRPSRVPSRWLLAVLAVAVSLFWVGKSVAWGRPSSAAGVAAFAFGLVGLASLALSAGRGDAGRPASVLTVAAAFWQSVAGALAALIAPYVGAAQTLGAWSATLGGFMFAGYLATLAGRRDALSLQGMAGFNAAWVSFLLLMMPLMFATSGSRLTYVVAELSGLAAPLLVRRAALFDAAPEFLRPVVLGAATAAPAAIAVGVAYLGIF